MAGRGRGRGRQALSFNVEALGIMHGEALPGPCLQPPPAYPLLEHHPAPLVLTPASVIQVAYKVDLLNYFSKEAKVVNYPWDYFPSELKPGVKKRKANPDEAVPSTSKKSALKATNIDQLLANLEKNETTQVKVEVDENEEEKEKADDEEEELIDTDEEMDDGTDYNQNYFDNGEGYIDDDDDMDDGPIY
ncbi:DNA-directed RNA polymerase III subunit RPC7-like [Halyomorpha halys]|uniref:DNA-directed RNA polymerase III subunit RPC7-like n=1 Tax=Halyomorpha halys TaxID=286706 RepID=UPI0006D4EB6D|nr:DNA-directed RNA polymerase III subunit RPC7-like [Halyomorpha halys]XP_014279110.1 DNA-directed RNA polymerase III subunit RPC7-like [Halyomorpha halys]XP_014279111.1 DNA-directed RNA polymerase III subunit RPC7-like [Halyomorpha halys]XP_014279112.1 DNA-directed RNA polymerase III subunit RPC7-like [Halyomorpha halys]XP_014279113.1 DNA-directed RNA polymerase III subunit RPC7-like [Halyomorpha halys]XP_014279114.1 DNA-directed RNA polymerase III subunit RPC7-like [Halyomorpha halys]XP_01